MMRDFRDMTPPIVSSGGKTIVLHADRDRSRVAVSMDAVQYIMDRNIGSRMHFTNGGNMDVEESLDDILTRLEGRV